MRRIFVFTLFLTLLTITGCGVPNDDMETVRDYIKTKGYNITSELSETDRYTLKKSMLWGEGSNMLRQQEWMVQGKEPDAYFGKEITIYAFTTDSHPLMDIYGDNALSVSLYVMMSDGKAIGGYSYPNMNSQVYGGSYSLDGKTYEEITGKTLQQWQEEWSEKYGE